MYCWKNSETVGIPEPEIFKILARSPEFAAVLARPGTDLWVKGTFISNENSNLISSRDFLSFDGEWGFFEQDAISKKASIIPWRKITQNLIRLVLRRSESD